WGPGFFRERPERVVRGSGIVVRPVRIRGDEGALHPVVEPPAELRYGVVDAGRRDDRLADQPAAPGGAEVREPFVVGAHARELELAVVGVRPRAGERDARVEDLRPDAVGVEVVEARRGIEAARPDVLVAISFGPELEIRQPRGRGEAERAEALPVVERPDVAALRAEDLRRARAETLRDAHLPEVGRLV